MIKNEMIKKHDLTKKTCLKVQCYNSKDYNKCTKYIGMSCVRSYNVLLGMVRLIDNFIWLK